MPPNTQSEHPLRLSRRSFTTHYSSPPRRVPRIDQRHSRLGRYYLVGTSLASYASFSVSFSTFQSARSIIGTDRSACVTLSLCHPVTVSTCQALSNCHLYPITTTTKAPRVKRHPRDSESILILVAQYCKCSLPTAHCSPSPPVLACSPTDHRPLTTD